MLSTSYDANRKSLYHPGETDDFFRLGPMKNDAAMCEEMSRLTYVKGESRLAQYLNRAGFELDMAIDYGSGGTQVFVANRQDDSLAVVAFRGTEPDNPSDLFTDANFVFTPWADNSGKLLGKVHKGFATALQDNDILGTVITCLDSLVTSTRILLTGQRLGAALATLSASRMPLSNLYAFGSEVYRQKRPATGIRVRRQ